MQKLNRASITEEMNKEVTEGFPNTHSEPGSLHMGGRGCRGRTKSLSNDPVTSWVQFSHSVVSDSLRPHGLQHARLPCPLPASGACSNSCPLSRWCHPNISSSVVPFSSCLQTLPATGSFLRSQFITPGGQSIGVSASASLLLMNIQDWFPLGQDMEQQTESKLRKEYVKAVYCHPAYLTYMQSTSREMLGWMKHKLESRLLGVMSITSDLQMTPPLWQKLKN